MSLLEAHPAVVCTVLDEGGVLLHLETKYYYSLNATALALWLHIESDLGELSAPLADRFPGEPERDAALQAFVADLERERLALPRAGAAATAGVPMTGSPLALAVDAAWAAPRLTRHEAPLNQILSNPFDPCVPLAE